MYNWQYIQGTVVPPQLRNSSVASQESAHAATITAAITSPPGQTWTQCQKSYHTWRTICAVKLTFTLSRFITARSGLLISFLNPERIPNCSIYFPMDVEENHNGDTVFLPKAKMQWSLLQHNFTCFVWGLILFAGKRFII